MEHKFTNYLYFWEKNCIYSFAPAELELWKSFTISKP